MRSPNQSSRSNFEPSAGSAARARAALTELARNDPSAAAGWLAFERPWASDYAPDRLAEAIPDCPPAALERAAASSRASRRLAQWALGKWGAPPTLQVAFQGRRRLALLDAEQLQRAASFAGCAWRAEELRSLIFGAERRLVADALGEDAVAFGVRHHHLAAVAARFDEPEAIARAIDRDARRLLRAWIEREPPCFAIRLRARLSEAALGSAAPADRHRRRCLKLFDQVAEDWFRDDEHA